MPRRVQSSNAMQAGGGDTAGLTGMATANGKKKSMILFRVIGNISSVNKIEMVPTLIYVSSLAEDTVFIQITL